MNLLQWKYLKWKYGTENKAIKYIENIDRTQIRFGIGNGYAKYSKKEKL